MRNNYSALLGTELIQGGDRPQHTRQSAGVSKYWTAWLLAVVVLTPGGIVYGKLAAARKISQMQQCVSRSGDFDTCRRANNWPFKSFSNNS